MPLPEERRRQLDDIVIRMQRNNENDESIQLVVNDFKQKYGDYGTGQPQRHAAAPQQPAESTFLDRIGFGTPNQRTPFGLSLGAAKAIFPRTMQEQPESVDSATPKSIASGVQDVLSLPGRAIAAAPSLIGQAARGLSDRVGTNVGNKKNFVESLQDTEGQNIVDKIARDPITPLSVVSGVGASKYINPKIPGTIGKAIAGIGAGAVEGTVAGGSKQAFNIASGEGFDGKELAADIAGSAVTGGLSEVAADLLRYSLSPAMFRSSIIPNKQTRLKGFDPENIVKYDVGGSFNTIQKKASGRIAEAKQAADTYLETFAKSNPDAKVDIDGVIQNFLQELDDGTLDQFFAADQLDAAENAADKILNAFNKRGYTGTIDLPTANKAKRWLGKGVFKKGPNVPIDEAASAKVKELIDLKIRDEIQKIAPEIAEYNKVMSDLIPIRQAAEDAAERHGNRNVFTGMTNMQIGQAGAIGSAITGNPGYIAGTVGLAGLNNVLSPGRGAQLVNAAGKEIQGIGRSGGRSLIGTNIINPEEERKKREAMIRQSAQFK